jgi:hypothetical protein
MAMATLATILAAQDKNTEAISLLSECLEIAVKTFGRKHTAVSEMAWKLVQTCGPHEAARRQAPIVRYLSWLIHESPDRLTGTQKNIRDGLRGNAQGRKNSAAGKKRPQRRKKRR